MAVSRQTQEFLKYAIKNVGKGRNAKISNLDKVSAPYLINQYTTWGQVYDAAVKEYYAQGGTADDVNKLKDPNYKPPTPGAPTPMSPERAALDPIGLVMQEKGISVTTNEDGVAELKDKNGVTHYLYVDTYTDSFGKKLERVNISADYDAIVNKTISDYQGSPNGVNDLFNSLYQKNLITKETFNSKNISAPDFKKGLQYAIRQYSISAFDARQYNQKLTVGTLKSYLGSNALPGTGGKGGTSTDIRRQETTRPDSDEEANRFSIENLGRPANKAEKDAYFNMLNAAEKKAVVKSVTTTGDSSRSGVDSGSFIDQTDKILMLGKVFADSITGSDLDTIIKSGAGAAQTINSIKTYATRYGITLSDEQAVGYVASNMKSGKNLDATFAKIQKLSKIKYSNLADFIDDDTSVEDIGSEVIYKVSQLTGIPYKSLSVNNSVVAKALSNNGKKGVMTDAEVATLVRTDPETKQLWLKTPAAKEEASGYALEVLRSFGLMA